MSVAELRAAIYQALVQTVEAVEGRVYAAHVPDAETPKPYLVLRLADTTGEIASPAASDQRLEIWAYSEDSPAEVDELVAAVRQAIESELAAAGWRAEYVGQSADIYDDVWRAVGRRVDYVVPFPS